MKHRNIDESSAKWGRMIGTPELCLYIGMGQTAARKFGLECGAARKIGRRTLYDRNIIDKALDELANE